MVGRNLDFLHIWVTVLCSTIYSTRQIPNSLFWWRWYHARPCLLYRVRKHINRNYIIPTLFHYVFLIIKTCCYSKVFHQLFKSVSSKVKKKGWEGWDFIFHLAILLSGGTKKIIFFFFLKQSHEKVWFFFLESHERIGLWKIIFLHFFFHLLSMVLAIDKLWFYSGR